MASSKSWLASLLAFAIALSPLVAAEDEALLMAVHQERIGVAKNLLEEGADPNAANRYGITPLRAACENGNTELIAALLSAGAGADSGLRAGHTPLMTAARTGRTEPIKLLLDAGARVNARDNKGQTALMWAAVEGHTDAVKSLLAAGAKRDATLKSGFDAWFFAARQGHLGVIDVLLENGAPVNAAIENGGGGGRAPKNGTSALILAIENGHFDLAAQLLDAGADANDRRSGYSPLHVLTWVRKPVRGDGIDGAPPPRESGKTTSLQFADLLIKHGAKIDAQLARGATGGRRLGRPGATPFLLAARTADLPLMKFLIKHGADFRLPNKQGRTPLLAATGVALGPEADEAATEDEAILAATYLLELGANIDIVDKEGETVMHSAAYKQAPKLVHFLARRGADISVWNKKNKHGWTPLLIAQGFRHGNFKPSDRTIVALSEVMRVAGVEPPPPPHRPGAGKKEKYGD